MDALREVDGKLSFTRLMGAVALAVVLGVYASAALAGQWDIVKGLSGELLLLVFGLYGINRGAAAFSPSSTRTPQ